MQASDARCAVSLVSTEETHVTQAQRDAMLALQIECFGQGEVTDEELYEDFVARELARVFAYQGEEMVGCVSVYRRPVRYAGRDMLLGGYGGVCVRKDLRRQGIGLALCREAHRSCPVPVDCGFSLPPLIQWLDASLSSSSRTRLG
jgi:predicted N-acetyltransferase YhbS